MSSARETAMAVAGNVTLRVPMNRWSYSTATDQFGAKPTSIPVPTAPPAGFARLIIFDAGCGEEGAVFVVGDRSATLHVPKNVAPGVADLAGEEADGVDLGLVCCGNQ